MMPAISVKAKKQITKQIDLVVKKYLKKTSDSSDANSGNPFVMALLKDFEPLLHRIHGLKTSLGYEMEIIAEIIAIETWGKNNVTRKSRLDVSLPQNVFQKIDSIINGLSNVKFHPNYGKEKNEIFEACDNPSKKIEKHKYEFDLRLYDNSKKHYYFLEMKGPDPNTTEVPGAKRRLLSALAWGYHQHKTKKIDSIIGIYFNNKHPKPYKNPKVLNYFDPAGDMKVQEAFWNFIGKSSSTYSELLQLFENYGKKNKKKIWTGFSKLIDVK
jgi:hypothetical protein